MKVKLRWLLMSDIHFKPYDLDRVIRTADWIAYTARQYDISRAVICGDLLTTRASQPTHVLSACYRFLDKLTGVVPHVNIILGNHDLAYRRDYTTSALAALSISRLAPFITLHSEIASHEWDGKRVFVMPFREEQGEIVKALRDLDPKEAATTLGFGHLAVNRAITQKHVIDPQTGEAGRPMRYPGLTGVGNFAPLARTFTGHFHSHQAILQVTNQQTRDLQGSVTYIGAPLQLTWADLFDTQRGVVLLDPESLEHELVVNPHAVGYTAVGAQEVLADRIGVKEVQDKHVMITGKLLRHEYVSTRDRLIKLGVRSVRDLKPVAVEWQSGSMSLGKTVLPDDIQNQPDTGRKIREELGESRPPSPAQPLAVSSLGQMADGTERKPFGLAEMVKEYVSSLDLGALLDDRREILTLVGKRLLEVSKQPRDKAARAVKYKDMLDLSPRSTLFLPSTDTPGPGMAQNIFAAQPVSIEITNFLSVQGTLRLDFKLQFQPGINFIVGHNGAGKSTIIEAITWCQFGQCIRGGLGVNDVVNDVVKKNCSVHLTFANGYTISRYRKHKEFHNRVIIKRDGMIQTQFEGPNAKSTQASIDDLLGVDFSTFVRIVVLGNESTASFLSSTPLEKRQLIETVLGLEVLDGGAEICKSMLNEVDKELGDIRSQVEAKTHTIGYLTSRVKQMDEKLRCLRDEAASLTKEMQIEQQKQAVMYNEKELERNKLQEELQALQPSPESRGALLSIRKDVSQAQDEVDKLGVLTRLAQARASVDRERAIIEQNAKATKRQLNHLEKNLEHLLEENSTLEAPASATQGDKDKKSTEASSGQGFLLSIASAFHNLWTFILQLAGPAARRKRGMGEQAAFRAGEAVRRWDEHVRAVAGLSKDVAETQDKVANMMESIANLHRDVANRTCISECDVDLAVRRCTAREALSIPGQLTAAIEQLRTLTKREIDLQCAYESQKEKWLRKQSDLEEYDKKINMTKKGWADLLHQLRFTLASKEQEIATNEGHLEADAKSLVKYRQEACELDRKAEGIHSHREIFAFWQSAFTRRQVAASTATFRGFVIERHLGELNRLLTQILMVMYQDARYARTATTGALKALFEADSEDNYYDNEEGKNISVLEPSLSIASTLDYAKKSGGERKRVDLALFFALFMISEFRSPYRAGYMLVDEAFDSLDEAGQASVLKWCRWSAKRLTYLFVITHSQSLVRIAEEEGAAEGGVGASVVTAKAGDRGTELEVNGVRIGIPHVSGREHRA
ncbi:hypothetical protein DL766_002397 [Monosporascus sp. MC13-8B]|uniref:Rad50/SbcC-type AAA domain-containing protein n=1 Tax=Monosporascus cannonballus TaxID=155416 RepID=A0ABY0HF85_9PEZI|nr:hypothetical protein DL762_001976 [Monosporascus cannonballus]RYO97102.1 hypothetical protein DL763_002892 [Monosporascus cannonballus]RYP35664.1 hypothetical protein DL766_002397 [Monosporascus sp. MC13-8B]